jgi:hypothetical protein
VVDLNRRWFVFGSVAAVAAAALPSPARAFLEPPVERLPSAHVFLKRAIRDFSFGFDVPAGTPDEIAGIKVFVHRAGTRAECPFLHIVMNVKSTFRWVAPPHDPSSRINLMPEDTFEIEVDSDQLVGKFYLIADDTVDEGPPITVVETHDWPQTGPAAPMYLHADNSLEARIARRDLAMQSALDDDDDGDDYPEDDYDV